MDFNRRFKTPENLVQWNQNAEILKFYGEGHLLNRLYIHWDLLTKCNFDCSYCYAKRYYKSIGEWQKLSEFDTQAFIIKSISLSTLPVFLGLQGGEPTIDPNFIELYNLIQSEILSKNKENRLYITSNLSTDIWQSVIKHTKNFSKVFILASFHPETNYFDKFYSNLKFLSEKFKCRVNLMLKPDKELDEIYESLKKLNVSIHPHFIYEGNSRWNLMDIDFKKFESMQKEHKEFIVETPDGNSKISDFELFQNDKHHFYGYKCFNNNFEIDFQGNTKVLCKSTKISLLENPLFFKKITKIEPMICTWKSCSCDGLLKVLKCKNT